MSLDNIDWDRVKGQPMEVKLATILSTNTALVMDKIMGAIGEVLVTAYGSIIEELLIRLEIIEDVDLFRRIWEASLTQVIEFQEIEYLKARVLEQDEEEQYGNSANGS